MGEIFDMLGLPNGPEGIFIIVIIAGLAYGIITNMKGKGKGGSSGGGSSTPPGGGGEA